ncbi:SAM-dependent methyltransferase [Halobacteriales archaeon SW_7_68_16]|nr:MAG: SAM-dependent methyltransferase [Halobacteriales archaeon SW_7_68_16]
MEQLSRYRPIVDDFEAFRAACERPLPSVVRVNTIKTSVAATRRAFEAAGVSHGAVEWNDRLFRLTTDRPGRTWPAAHGWTYGQEEVSALPALVLDPEPGDRVFDPCAAPGSKTTQLAALMDDRGTLVANDSNLGRISALRSNAERLGVTNVAVTNGDGRNFSMTPFEFDTFDRALADVPCSCEGTIRKNPTALADWSLDHVEGIAGVQEGILRRAIQVTKPGGRVVYSTCTFAPEENEAVLDAVVATEDCSVVPFESPLSGRPGITEWNGTEYDPSVANALRVYPHHEDTGGFFCAAVEVGA